MNLHLRIPLNYVVDHFLKVVSLEFTSVVLIRLAENCCNIFLNVVSSLKKSDCDVALQIRVKSRQILNHKVVKLCCKLHPSRASTHHHKMQNALPFLLAYAGFDDATSFNCTVGDAWQQRSEGKVVSG